MFFPITSTGRWWYSCQTQSFLPRKRKVAGRKGGKCTEVDMKFSLLCYSCVGSWHSPLEYNTSVTNGNGYFQKIEADLTSEYICEICLKLLETVCI